tara:strand:- start:338 stop:667 length:330 start_codon:yes stop_codon:yes gene_type:complete
MAKLQEKFLIFIDAADDAAMYPLSNLLGITVASDGQLLLKFKSSVGGSTGTEHDSVALTITADTEKAVMQSIAKACGDAYSDAAIVIADDVNSVYVNSNITACAITLDS